MIEKLRKYTGLTICIFVVLFISFFFMDTNSASSMSGGRPMLKIAGQTYSDKEVQTYGNGAYELIYALVQSGDYDLYQVLMTLTAGSTGKDDASENLFTNRMILREAKAEFGVFPGEEEITSYLRALKAFSPEGKFSADNYRNFVDKGMGRLGMTEKDLRELVSDILAIKKLNAIIGGGLGTDRNFAATNLALSDQQITGEVGKLELSPFEEKINPTEEEIKAYWEVISDAFTTEPRRKFSYIIATPEVVEEPKSEDAPDSIADAAASDEAKKEAAKKKEEEKAKRAAELAENRRKKQLEIDAKVDDFLYNLEEQKGAGFEDLAKANGWTVITSEFFTKAAPPKDLDVTLRASSRGGKAVDELFSMEQNDEPFSKISSAIAVGENQWIVARIDDEEKSRAKSYEEARADARAKYIEEKATEAMKTAANEAVTKIKTLMSAGKSFADAAKEAGVTETKAFTSINSTYRADGATEPQNLFEAARNVEIGGIADVITESDRTFILHVAKREVLKEADLAAKVDREISTQITRNETSAFIAWIAARKADANVEQLNKKQ